MVAVRAGFYIYIGVAQSAANTVARLADASPHEIVTLGVRRFEQPHDAELHFHRVHNLLISEHVRGNWYHANGLAEVYVNANFDRVYDEGETIAPSDDVLDITQAAEICGVHVNTIRRWIDNDMIASFRAGKQIRFMKSQVIAARDNVKAVARAPEDLT